MQEWMYPTHLNGGQDVRSSDLLRLGRLSSRAIAQAVVSSLKQAVNNGERIWGHPLSAKEPMTKKLDRRMSENEMAAARESLMALIEIGPEDLKPGILIPSKLLAGRLLDHLDDEGRRKSGMALRTSIERCLSGHPVEEIRRKNPGPIPANAETIQS